MPTVLVVEDEVANGELIAINLRHAGFEITLAETADQALAAVDAVLPDLVLLDWMLPGQSGVSLARRWRAGERTKELPIIMLTARADESDKVMGLDAGADDYLTKPFGLSELHARMRAVLRRAAGPAADTEGRLILGPVVLDVPNHKARVNDTPLDLTPREFELLKVLLSQSGRVVTAGRLLRAVWGSAYSDEAHYLHVYVSRLRRKLAAADPTGAAGHLIVAEPGVGYRIVAG